MFRVSAGLLLPAPRAIIQWSAPGNHPRRGFWHWSAMGYAQPFPDYTYIVMGIPLGEVRQNYADTNTPVFATWHENRDSIDIAAMCMQGGQLFGAWACPPLPLQIERMAYLAAQECARWDIPVTDWLTHCEIAERDGYGPDSHDPDLRWDFISLDQASQTKRNGGLLLRGKTQWYLDTHFIRRAR